MPMPTPRDGEDHDGFISRCMADDVMVEDFEDQDQRLAVCEEQWESRKSMNPALQRAMRAVLAGQKFQDAAKAAGIAPGSADFTALRDLARKHFESRLPRDGTGRPIKTVTVGLQAKALASKDAPLVDDDRPGRLIAVFSTFNVMDSDGDVVLSGAVHEEEDVPFTFAHNWSEPSLGKGDVRVDHDRAVWDGYLFVEDMQKAKETFASIKNMGDRQEYSWSFYIKDASIEEDEDAPWGFKRIIKDTEMVEVCAAIRGVNRQTQTLYAKSEAPGMAAGGMFAAAFDAAYEWLQGHDTTAGEGKGSRFEDQIRAAQAAVADVVARASSLAETRAQEGRTIGKSSLDLLAGLAEALTEAAAALQDLAEPAEGDDGATESDADDELKAIFANSLRVLAEIHSQ